MDGLTMLRFYNRMSTEIQSVKVLIHSGHLEVEAVGNRWVFQLSSKRLQSEKQFELNLTSTTLQTASSSNMIIIIVTVQRGRSTGNVPQQNLKTKGIE